MPSITLAQSALLSDDDTRSGIIESIVTPDDFFEILPFDQVQGNSIKYEREVTLGAVATVGVGEDIGPTASGGTNLVARQSAKDPATFEDVSVGLTTIMGDAEVNQLLQKTRSSRNNQTAVQIASKAKSSGRAYSNMLINGLGGSNNEFAGLLSLVPITQKVPTAANGQALTFDVLDWLLDLPSDKDREVDYLLMNQRTLRSYNALLRTLPGASIEAVKTLPSGKTVPVYRNVPIFVNNYIPIDQVKGASGPVCTTIFAGTLDDGSRKMGIAGLTSEEDMGVHVEKVGVHPTRDEHVYRIKWYCGLALFSELGIASADGITN